MKEVGVLEAKTHFSTLLDEVAAGGEVTITRHGKPIAKLSPIEDTSRDRSRAVAAIRALREEIALRHGTFEDFDWKAAVEAGRP
jgi:prevent-host-death family protein